MLEHMKAIEEDEIGDLDVARLVERGYRLYEVL
jgi:hypothetical protein